MTKSFRYVAIDARIGIGSPRQISHRRQAFHEGIVKLCTGASDVQNVGEPLVEAISLPGIYRTPEESLGQIARRLTAQPIDFGLVDFSDSSAALQRDTLTGNLLNLFLVLGQDNLCSNFALLLPHSVRPWLDIDKDHREPRTEKMLTVAETALVSWQTAARARLFLFCPDGSVHHYPPTNSVPGYEDAFRLLQQPMLDSSEAAVKQGLVRRLGHFQSKRSPRTCRRFSYLIDQREDQLTDALEGLWHVLARDTTAVVFDAGHSPWLLTSVATLGTRRQMPFFPISQRDGSARQSSQVSRSLVSALSGKNTVLIVDVFDTGTTVEKHLKLLQDLKIQHASDVLAAVLVGPARQLTVGGRVYKVWGCTETDQEHFPPDTCPQCALRLGYTQDVEEDTERIRPFDFWDMARRSQWEAEPDKPKWRAAFELVPDFDEMLRLHGDWIGFKMARRLDFLVHYSVVYIDQAGARRVADRLKERVPSSIPFVAIPEAYVKAVTHGQTTWAQVASKAHAESWYRELVGTQKAPAIITDVFNGSGATFRSIYALLREVLDIPVVSYFPFINRDVGGRIETAYAVPLQTLYEWFGSAGRD